MFGGKVDLSLGLQSLPHPVPRRGGLVAVCVEAMTEDLTKRRKRIHFRSWHRGTQEADLLLGRFADRHLATMSVDELAQFEEVLELPEPDLMAWYIGTVEAPPELLSPVLRLVLDFKVID